MSEYYYANEGECFRSIINGFVLKVVKRNGRVFNTCIVAAGGYKVGDEPIMTDEDALKFSKDNFERYYCFDNYLKEIEDDKQGEIR